MKSKVSFQAFLVDRPILLIVEFDLDGLDFDFENDGNLNIDELDLLDVPKNELERFSVVGFEDHQDFVES